MTTAAARTSPPALQPQKTFSQRTKGYTPLDHKLAFYDLSRLAGGKTQLLCILYVLSETDGKARQEGTPAPEFSRPIPTTEFVWFCRETLSAVQASLQDLCKRGVLTREPAKRGDYTYSAPTATWATLQDYAPPKKAVASADEIDSASDDTDAENKEDPGAQPRILCLTPEPVKLKAGQPSRAIEAPTKIEKVQFDSNVAGQVDSTIKRGILRISFRLGIGNGQGEERANAQPRILGSNRSDVAITELSAAVQARGAPLARAVSARENAVEIAAAREVLNRWFERYLGPADDDLVLKAIAARGPATWPDCLKKLEARHRAGFCKTWGGVLQVILDVGTAAQRAGAPALSAGDQREWDAHVKRSHELAELYGRKP
jgi:hypothetical protein